LWAEAPVPIMRATLVRPRSPVAGGQHVSGDGPLVAEIMSVGTELLLGQITDTNATYISQQLAAHGVDVYYRTTLGDNLERVTEGLRLALSRADAVIITGGLGPTTDDVTREAIAAAFSRALVIDETARAHIERFFAERGYPMTGSNLKQALVPEGGELIANPKGTAPGVLVEADGKLVFAVPGVPREMQAMVDEAVVPRLIAALPEGLVIRSRVIRLAGIGESAMAKKVEDILVGQANPTVAPLVGRGDVILRITAKGESEHEVERSIADVESRIRERLGEYIYAVGEEPLEYWLVQALTGRGETLSIAESCTGGLVSDRITNVSGSSACYLGSVVSYDNEVKANVLEVSRALLAAHGAVSAEVAEAMATGVRRLCGSTYGLAATGIAGPAGGNPEKPVGLVYTAVAWPDGVESAEHRFHMDRLDNKQRASQAALLMLHHCLRRTA